MMALPSPNANILHYSQNSLYYQCPNQNEKTIDKIHHSIYIENQPRRLSSSEGRSQEWLFYWIGMEKRKKSIVVVDGQGGGIGSLIIKRLREAFAEEAEVIGLGTNAMATGAMLKAGANKGASGENAIVQTVKTVDIVIGTTSIVFANSMMGELTPKMAEAIASSPATKCLLPLKMLEAEIIGAPKEPLPHLVDQLIKRIQEILMT
jgi:hypothetical protein